MRRGVVQQLIKAFLHAKRSSNEERNAERRSANWTAGATVAIAFFTLASIGVGIAQWFAIQQQLADTPHRFSH